MTARGNGGAAFPVSEEAARGKVAGIYGGMTLRDYFAAKAMQELLGSLAQSRVTPQPDFKKSARAISEMAYYVADAMLAARGAG